MQLSTSLLCVLNSTARDTPINQHSARHKARQYPPMLLLSTTKHVRNCSA